MLPVEMSDSDTDSTATVVGKAGKDGKVKGRKGAEGGTSHDRDRVHEEDMPRDPQELQRALAAEQINIWRQLAHEIRGHGGGGGDDSDPGDGPSSSDTDFDGDGDPIPRGPAYYERQRKKRRRMVKKINPPTFKGEPGERPEAHILRTMDWFDTIGIVSDRSRLKTFRHTLDSTAREWFQDVWTKERGTLSWTDLVTKFSRYFSTQGRSLRHLHAAWRKFSFNPDTDDIEDFIRDVQECGKQLNYEDHSVMDMIKSCMPPSLYGTLYNMTSLTDVINICKDVYARSPSDKAKGLPPSTVTQATGVTPFSAMKDAETSDLVPNLNKLAEALNRLDFNQKPYKPQIYPKGRGRGRGGRGPPRGRGQGQNNFGGRGNFRSRGNFRGKSRGGRFDKSPTKKHPRVNSKTKDFDKDRCRYCREVGHWERDCPQKKKDQGGSEETQSFSTLTGLSEALPEFYGQEAAPIRNMFHVMSEVPREEEPEDQEQEYLNFPRVVIATPNHYPA